ncbi:MAG: cytochrome c biogenesis protein ResB [Phycisphaerae bacterium]
MWIVLLAIGLLAVLSMAGAFYGAEKAKLLFNSIPLVFYWYLLSVLFLAGFIEFTRLRRKPGLFMIHTGCLLILCGSMWGSEAGHRIVKRFFGIQKTPNGYMLISKGDSEKYIMAEDFGRRLGELPFSIKLKDFRIEYYQAYEKTPPQLDIKTQEGQQFQLIAKPGEEITLGRDKLRVVRTFTNFRIRIEDNKKVITDEGPQGENPAVEVSIETPDGNSHSRFVFEHFAGFSHKEDGLQLSYTSQGPQMIRDYFSDLAIIENGKEVLSKTIEVNHPLHYGGYHFYQHSYDSEMQKYTILSVTSDSGLYTVYAGYWMLVVGTLWQFWFRHIAKYIKDKKNK